MITSIPEFYPTPKTLLEKITNGINWRKIKTVLEPQAGKGDIADFIRDKEKECSFGNTFIDIDVIEQDPNLRYILEGKKYTVCANDFLEFRTHKQYDLIIMNPPFSNGDEHLMKALDIQKNGGAVLCILNAETIRNPYTNLRKELKNKLDELHAEITFYEDEFTHADRKTKVKIAVVKVCIPKQEYHSIIFENLSKKSYAADTEYESTKLVDGDYLNQIIANYNLEIEMGISLIKEYQALKPHLLNSVISKKYAQPILELKLYQNAELDINKYIEKVREKYWTALFQNPKFISGMTSSQLESNRSHVKELVKYDFSYCNIKELQIQMVNHKVKDIENSIMKLFEDFTDKYSYYEGCERNIHYYNGWCSNKAWIVNRKVIHPRINAWSYIWRKMDLTDYNVFEKLDDLEKVLTYLDSEGTKHINMYTALRQSQEEGITKKIQLTYFRVTFYKKGTCHIEFTNEEVWKKFNIFGSMKKGWLPPSYGKKHYNEMSPEEQKVIDEFEGETSYESILSQADKYIYSPKKVLDLSCSC